MGYMEEIDVTSSFKKQGDDVRVLIIHSPQHPLSQSTADLLTSKLIDVEVVKDARLSNFGEFIDLMDEDNVFNVLVLLGYGSKSTRAAWRFHHRNLNDIDHMFVKVGELMTAMKDHVTDKLCLFGVCVFGTDDLAQVICTQAGAQACIAPKAKQIISPDEIVSGYAALLNEMQRQKNVAIGPNELQNLMRQAMSPSLCEKLEIYPS